MCRGTRVRARDNTHFLNLFRLSVVICFVTGFRCRKSVKIIETEYYVFRNIGLCQKQATIIVSMFGTYISQHLNIGENSPKNKLQVREGSCSH